MQKSILLKSSLIKKYWMALTGLFLCIFLLGHVTGNLQLFIQDGGLQFNEYAKFMTTNPMVKILSYLTYFSILFHAIDGILLTIENRSARPIGYAKNHASTNSTWASRNMAILGSIILIFIIMHMSNFWAKMHFTQMPLDVNGNKDLYLIVCQFFRDPQTGLACVLLYTAAMVGLSFHLQHGFQSGFQSLGVRHPQYTSLIKKLGYLISIVVPIAFAAMPIYIYLTK